MIKREGGGGGDASTNMVLWGKKFSYYSKRKNYSRNVALKLPKYLPACRTYVRY